MAASLDSAAFFSSQAAALPLLPPRADSAGVPSPLSLAAGGQRRDGRLWEEVRPMREAPLILRVVAACSRFVLGVCEVVAGWGFSSCCPQTCRRSRWAAPRAPPSSLSATPRSIAPCEAQVPTPNMHACMHACRLQQGCLCVCAQLWASGSGPQRLAGPRAHQSRLQRLSLLRQNPQRRSQSHSGICPSAASTEAQGHRHKEALAACRAPLALTPLLHTPDTKHSSRLLAAYLGCIDVHACACAHACMHGCAWMCVRVHACLGVGLAG